VRHPIYPGLLGPVFDGFPYLAIKIGATNLVAVALIPKDWPRERLVDLARRQAAANQFETCACIGSVDAVYVGPSGRDTRSALLPNGIPVVERLALPEPIPNSTEVVARRARLVAFAESVNPRGFLVGDGLEGGRLASPDDALRLSTAIPDQTGVPRPAGLARCSACGWFRGDYLATKGEGNGDPRPRVVPIHCRCDNHNRCARCGEPLAESRLSAYEYREEDDSIWYLAAFAGLSHRCEESVELLSA
jgi:hypothetical protein